MKRLLARVRLWIALKTNKKVKAEYEVKKKMDKFYRKLRVGLWVLYLVDNKLDKLGFSRQQKKAMRRSYFKDGVLASSFLKRLITETNILKEIETYEQKKG